jgi:cytochrome P450
MATTTALPGPPSRFPGTHLLAFRRDMLGFLQRLSQTYGDVATFQLGSERVVLLSHPEHIQDVLVTHHRQFIKARRGDVSRQFLGEGLLNSEGDTHRRQRRLSQPAFHRQRVAQYGAVMTNYATRLSQEWQDGESIDAAAAMMRVTLAIAAKTLFDADVESDAVVIGRAISELLELSPRFSLPFAAVLLRLPLPSSRRLRQAQQVLDTTIYRIIEERRADAVDHGDLLSMLLLAQDEMGDQTGMTDRQLHDEALTLLLAGHETTAVALTWTWYLLSHHPEVEAALHAELDAVLGKRPPTVADLPNLCYTRQVFAEALRLYPPAWLMTRRNLDDFGIGKYTLPARTFIMISPYITHHDARFFPDPDAFQPQRWASVSPDNRPRSGYFPFGGGPRQCIGESFAWMEGMLLLATLAQQWQLRLVPDHPVALRPLVTLRPKYGMRMTLTRRRI